MPKLTKEALRLYLVTNENISPEGIESAILGGATMVQLREKNLCAKDFLEKAKRILEITRRYGVPFIINDRADIAAACGADGVHLGQSDLPAGEARRLLGPDKIIGVSTKTVEQAQKAVSAGADYLGVGAIFPTTTKVITQPTSVAVLSDICRTVPVPVVAIGGLNAQNAHAVKGSGVAGIAVVSAICNSNNTKKSAAELAALTRTMF